MRKQLARLYYSLVAANILLWKNPCKNLSTAKIDQTEKQLEKFNANGQSEEKTKKWSHSLCEINYNIRESHIIDPNTCYERTCARRSWTNDRMRTGPRIYHVRSFMHTMHVNSMHACLLGAFMSLLILNISSIKWFIIWICLKNVNKKNILCILIQILNIVWHSAMFYTIYTKYTKKYAVIRFYMQIFAWFVWYINVHKRV